MSVERGLDPADFVLAAFGGAGPVHGGDLMRLLSVNSLIIPRYPGILCANGLLATDLKYDFMVTKLQRSDNFNFKVMDDAFNELNKQANKRLALDNIVPKKRRIVRLADFRYSGQGTELSVSFPSGKVDKQTTNKAINNFHKLHKQLYTFSDPDAPVELVNLRVQAFGLLEHIAPPIIDVTKEIEPTSKKSRLAVIDQETFEEVKVFDRDELCHGHVIYGPAIIDQLDSTTILLRNQKLFVDQFGNLLIKECFND
jgi:N-methylhydantoinase A